MISVCENPWARKKIKFWQDLGHVGIILVRMDASYKLNNVIFVISVCENPRARTFKCGSIQKIGFYLGKPNLQHFQTSNIVTIFLTTVTTMTTNANGTLVAITAAVITSLSTVTVASPAVVVSTAITVTVIVRLILCNLRLIHSNAHILIWLIRNNALILIWWIRGNALILICLFNVFHFNFVIDYHLNLKNINTKK